jgi:hypothetical protein
MTDLRRIRPGDEIFITFPYDSIFSIRDIEEKVEIPAGSKVPGKFFADMGKDWKVRVDWEGLNLENGYRVWRLKKEMVRIQKRYVKDVPSCYYPVKCDLDKVTIELLWVENLELRSEMIYIPQYCLVDPSKRDKSPKFTPEATDALYDEVAFLLIWDEPNEYIWTEGRNTPFNPDATFLFNDTSRKLNAALYHMPGVPLKVEKDLWDEYFEMYQPLIMDCYCEIDGVQLNKTLFYVSGEGTCTGGIEDNGNYYLVSIPPDALIWTHLRSEAKTMETIFHNR